MSSIGGLDPLADAYNLIGAQEMTGPNPYLEYQGQIPMAGYQGAPTNAATGQPISSYQTILNQLNAANPGTTLNTPPPSAGNPSFNAAAQADFLAGNAAGQSNLAVLGYGPGGSIRPGSQAAMYGGQQQPTQQPVAQPAGGSSAANQRQAYLQAMANPGAPPSYGAQMLPGASMTGPVGAGQPSVLQAFLAAHPSGGTSIPGGYTNQPFFSTLNQLQAGKGAST